MRADELNYINDWALVVSATSDVESAKQTAATSTSSGHLVAHLVRALAWLGPEKAGEALRALRAKLPQAEMTEVASARARLPTWMAQEVSALVPHD